MYNIGMDIPVKIKSAAKRAGAFFADIDHRVLLTITASLAVLAIGLAAGKSAISLIAGNGDERVARTSNMADGEPGEASSTGEKEIADTAEEQYEPPKAVRRIDGSLVEAGEENNMPYAVMIENHVDSRPPAGLSKAQLVYEAEAEGGITRFLAVYAGTEPISRIGPVRSARPYYIDWANEYGALYIHCGGSPDALAKIIAEDVFDMNEFYRGRYFWRDASRSAPHNVYTSTENIYNYLKENSPEVPDYLRWAYKEEAVMESRATSSEIAINYKTPAFKVTWKYGIIDNDYTRYYGDNPHSDEDGTPIRAKNVILQFVSSQVIDDYGRRAIKTSGQGRAAVCRDGSCEEGEWEKAPGGRTRFVSPGGADLPLNPGTTWIEIVPAGYKAAWTP